MRTLKFRAQSLNEETSGSLIEFELYDITQTFPDDDVIYVRRMPVDMNTIEEFTGIFDKDGAEIFEGDILLQHHLINGKWQSHGNPLIVEWIQNDYQTGWNIFRGMKQMKIIGNISETPDLKKHK